MIEEFASDSADDVQIRCRVRHSEFAAYKYRDLDEPQEMICTMRIFDPVRGTPSSSLSKSKSHGSQALHHSSLGGCNSKGPELVLNPILQHVRSNQMIYGCCSGELGATPVTLSKRFESFGSPTVNVPDQLNTEKQQPPKPKSLGIITIPIADIKVVDMYGAGDSHRSNITTTSQGYFEFTLESRNGQEVLLAFLKANIPKERVMDGQAKSQASASTRSLESFDVEAFTASRMAERVESESFSEKLRRRVVKVVSSIEEISSALSECACGGARNPCGGTRDRAGTPMSAREKRDSPPRQFQYDRVELSQETETPDQKYVRSPNRGYTMSNTNSYLRREKYKHSHLPNGISIEESEPELESTTGY